MITLRGSLSIGRTSGRDDNPIRIELIDEDAACTVVQIRMSLLEFAECITGKGHCDCVFEFNDSGVVGKQAQSKSELVPIPSYPRDKGDWEKKALAPFEVDGWKARESDISNHHCWSREKSGQEYQRVVFFRHVPKEPK